MLFSPFEWIHQDRHFPMSHAPFLLMQQVTAILIMTFMTPETEHIVVAVPPTILYCSNVWWYSCCGFVHFLFPFYLCGVTLPLYQSFLSLLSELYCAMSPVVDKALLNYWSVHNGVTTHIKCQGGGWPDFRVGPPKHIVNWHGSEWMHVTHHAAILLVCDMPPFTLNSLSTFDTELLTLVFSTQVSQENKHIMWH